MDPKVDDRVARLQAALDDPNICVSTDVQREYQESGMALRASMEDPPTQDGSSWDAVTPPGRKQKSPNEGEESDGSDGPNVENSTVARGQQPKRGGYRHTRRAHKRGKDGGSSVRVNHAAAEKVRRNQPMEELSLSRGEISPPQQVFCPWTQVIKYPSSFIGKTNRKKASLFFESPAVFDCQVWDFFYIHHPPVGSGNKDDGERPIQDRPPVLFVPTAQLEHLLEYINAALDINLTIPYGTPGDRFNVEFGIAGAPRPRYLGRSRSLISYVHIKRDMPGPDPADDLESVSAQAGLRHRELLEGILRTSSESKKVKAKKEERARLRVQHRRDWGRMTKRVQRYLGLRSRIGGARQDDLLANDMSRLELNQFPFSSRKQQDPPAKFVCVDVETYEFNHEMVTEVGFAVIDTALLRGTLPGDSYQHWFALMQARHIRVKEHAWARNGVHVPGHADQFNFGASEVVALAEMQALLVEMLGPLSPRRVEAWVSKEGVHQEDQQEDWEQYQQYQRYRQHQQQRKEQPIVLVGHDVGQDVAHLLKLRYDLRRSAAVFDVADTRSMFQHWQRRRDPTKLRTVLDVLGLPHRYLHNAGNDAVYTLQAMLMLADRTWKESLERRRGGCVDGDGEKGKQTGDSREEKGDAEGEEDDGGGWNTGGEMSDGGSAVALEGSGYLSD